MSRSQTGRQRSSCRGARREDEPLRRWREAPDQKAEVRHTGRAQVEGSGLAIVIFSEQFFFSFFFSAVRCYFTGNDVSVQVKEERI